MNLKCGIVGLPNVGKSTLFNALTKAKVASANYPFCTIDLNIGIVSIPDERLDILASLVNPKKIVPAAIEFVDIAGLVQGASKGEGLGNQFLANIRQVSAIIHVIRCFEDNNITHVTGKVDPVRDKEIIDTELQLKDLETIEKKINKMKKLINTGDKKAKETITELEKFKAHIEKGKNARTLKASDKEFKNIDDMFLLTAKPIIYVANVAEGNMISENQHVVNLKNCILHEEPEFITVSSLIEQQIASFEDEEEKQLFLKEYGLKESGLNRLIKICYQLLSLITYFTAGEKEVRAWTIQNGWKAPNAAGVIHSDFERGFIKAKVVKLKDYQYYGSVSACQKAGKVRTEGKEYTVIDGDIINFKFNV